MPDAAFANERLAALYDVAEAERGDLVHYEAIVEELGAESILDIGCGTGTLAVTLAAKGLAVVGLDPAAASLELARQKPYADQVRWVGGTIDDLHDLQVDVALMTGNVAQVFLDDDEWLAVLAGAYRCLNPGGTLVFEVRDPAFQGWTEWTKDQSLGTVVHPAGGEVTKWVEVTEVRLPLVSFRHTYVFTDATLTSDSTLRFRERSEIEDQLAASGFSVVDVRDAPDRPGKEFVFLCAKPRLAAASG